MTEDLVRELDERTAQRARTREEHQQEQIRKAILGKIRSSQEEVAHLEKRCVQLAAREAALRDAGRLLRAWWCAFRLARAQGKLLRLKKITPGAGS